MDYHFAGECFACTGATARHCAIYRVEGNHDKELKDYDSTQARFA